MPSQTRKMQYEELYTRPRSVISSEMPEINPCVSYQLIIPDSTRSWRRWRRGAGGGQGGAGWWIKGRKRSWWWRWWWRLWKFSLSFPVTIPYKYGAENSHRVRKFSWLDCRITGKAKVSVTGTVSCPQKNLTAQFILTYQKTHRWAS